MNNRPVNAVLAGMRIYWRPRRRRDRGTAQRPSGTGAVRAPTAPSETVPVKSAPRESAPRESAPRESAPRESAPRESAPRDSRAVETAPGEAVAAAMQLAIGLLTASLDSPELEAWAVEALTPHDADGMGNFMAGLHVVSELLLHELGEATGEPPEATMQRLAFLAEQWRGPSAAA
jgi:hypothetical protein